MAKRLSHLAPNVTGPLRLTVPAREAIERAGNCVDRVPDGALPPGMMESIQQSIWADIGASMIETKEGWLVTLDGETLLIERLPESQNASHAAPYRGGVMARPDDPIPSASEIDGDENAYACAPHSRPRSRDQPVSGARDARGRWLYSRSGPARPPRGILRGVPAPGGAFVTASSRRQWGALLQQAAFEYARAYQDWQNYSQDRSTAWLDEAAAALQKVALEGGQQHLSLPRPAAPRPVDGAEILPHLPGALRLLDARGRHGGLVPIPELRHAIQDRIPGLTREAFDAGLIALERAFDIDLKIANDPRTLPGASDGIEVPGRGLIYYAVVR